jgi:DNA repair protein RadA/Sms
MAKERKAYVCQQCGTAHPRWQGKCDGCGAWNTLVEERAAPERDKPGQGGLVPTSTTKSGLVIVPLAAPEAEIRRLFTGNQEFDRVCGGGLVPGAAFLIGGEPGIGKSTLLLQLAAQLSEKVPCLYVTGEESLGQVRLRAKRLGVEGSPLGLAATTNVRDILGAMESRQDWGLLVIDSIQTLYADVLDSAPGTVAQVRTCAHELIRAAKKHDCVLLLVGHVTKDGAIAGPKVLEHMVDTVLTFEGDRSHTYRMLRAVKNRFGATDEIGVFTMGERGLEEVANPSALFLSERRDKASGSAVFAGIEGTRPLLVEIQALVAPAPYGTPRRTTVGWDSNRLAMLLAVLETRAGMSFADKEVYLNVAGGLRIQEPAADMAVAAALVSALANVPIPMDAVFFGEVGLSGDVRRVGHAESRLKEAAKLGFTQAFTPDGSSKASAPTVAALRHVRELRRLVA